MPVEALYRWFECMQWGLNGWKPWALPTLLLLFSSFPRTLGLLETPCDSPSSPRLYIHTTPGS